MITNETKIRFARMLAKRQIIVIQFNKSSRSRNYYYKFIGANEYEKFDFTPMIAEVSGWPTTKGTINYLAIKSNDGVAVVADTIKNLASDGLIQEEKTGYALYEEVRDLLTTFYL